MKRLNICSALLGFGLLMPVLTAQTPIQDTVVVQFANSVRVGSQTIEAGEYTIRQLGTASNPRLLEFTTNSGTKIQATATAIAALDNNNRNESSVILENRGGVQHLHRIWIRGKSYGYEFPVGDSTERAVAQTGSGLRMSAAFEPNQVVAAATPAPAPEPTPEPVRAPEPAPVERTEPQAPAVVADNRPVEAPVEAAQTAPQDQQPGIPERQLPSTSFGWAMLTLAGGGILTAAGIMHLLNKQQRH